MTSIIESAVPAEVPMNAGDVAPSEATLRAHEDRLRRRESLLRIVVPAGIVIVLLLAWNGRSAPTTSRTTSCPRPR